MIDQIKKFLLDTDTAAGPQTEETGPSENQSTPQPPLDHSLALAAGNELFRIRKRLARMQDDIQGLKPIRNALDRLENALNTNGYELIDLEGQPYTDGLNVNAGFVTSDTVEPGSQVITLVIKPQINYDGILIQQANIEVTIGEEKKDEAAED